jgi:hypothetical protein
MNKTYITPDVKVIDIATDGVLCQASARGGYDEKSISKESEETLVKGDRGYSATSVDWEGWE